MKLEDWKLLYITQSSNSLLSVLFSVWCLETRMNVANSDWREVEQVDEDHSEDRKGRKQKERGGRIRWKWKICWKFMPLYCFTEFTYLYIDMFITCFTRTCPSQCRMSWPEVHPLWQGAVIYQRIFQDNKKLLPRAKVLSLLSKHICQDPLKKFFGQQRQRGQVNENPNVAEFLRNTQASGSLPPLVQTSKAIAEKTIVKGA